MPAEIPLALFVALQWVLFVLGSKRILQSVWKTETPGAPAAALVLLAVGLTPVGTWLPFGTLPFFQAGVLAVEAIGLWRLVGAWRSVGPALSRHGFVCVLTVLNFLFWLWVLGDVDGLPSHHDGIAHTLYFLRIVENSQPLIHLNPVAMRDLFGDGFLRFYPGGSHALVAMFDGRIPHAWATPAQILKAWLLLLSSGAPLLAYSIARAMLPARSPWVYGAVALAALTYYRFPVWQVPNGGFSRHAALFVLFPLVAEWVRASPPLAVRRVLLLIGPIATFLLHPGGFALFSLTWFWALIVDRPRWRQWLPDLALAATGYAGVVAMVKLTGSDSHFVQAVPGVATATGYGQLVKMVLLIPSVFDDFSHAAVAPLSARELILYIVMGAAFTGAVRAFAPARVWGYPWFLFTALTAVFLLPLVPVGFVQLIPQLFYNHPDRAAEAYYVAIVAVWALGAAYLFDRRHTRWGKVGIALVCLLGAVDTAKGLFYFGSQIPAEIRAFHSPLRSTSGMIVENLQLQTEPHALIVAEPFLLDSIESRALRRSLFIFSECPAGSVGENCARREGFYNEMVAAAGTRFGDTRPPTGPCMAFTRRLDRPVYWLRRTGPQGLPCTDLQRISQADGFDLFQILTH